MSDGETRFGGIQRLFGNDGIQRLHAAHVCVVGIGGVGSWAVEALARSGIGTLTLVDLDEVCISNVNRQIHALDGTVGRPKVDVMAERIRAIHSACRVIVQPQFFSETTAETLLSPRFDYVLDAIDGVTNKTLLLARCRQRRIPVVACGGAGGRRAAAAVRVADLSKVTHDRLLAEVRKRLRKHHDFPVDGKSMGVDCVFSPEPPVFAGEDGTICETRPDAEEGTRLNCNGGLGSATFVTGTFGFVAAGLIVNRIAGVRTSAYRAVS
ncbi:MAG TPA: tRNA threonylcarbamoyladenosine dehydratase [Verrucomicrobiota bacterium]|nr:tRNA threonylcarbamoyladenosine dehydratase [Verrucomicrobiota bacterium]